MGVPAKLPSESTNKRFKNGKQATIYFKLYSVINLSMGCSKKKIIIKHCTYLERLMNMCTSAALV